MKDKGEINSLLTSMDRLPRNRIIKEILTINDTLELGDIHTHTHTHTHRNTEHSMPIVYNHIFQVHMEYSPGYIR